MAYVVTAGRVSAETQVAEEGGRAVIDFHRGSVLPDDVPDEQVQRFLAAGHIALEEDAAPEPEPEPEVDLSELDKDALLALAEERGVQVDKRWGEDKLRAALEEN